MARLKRTGVVAIPYIHAFAGLLAMSLVACVFLWYHLPLPNENRIDPTLDDPSLQQHQQQQQQQFHDSIIHQHPKQQQEQEQRHQALIPKTTSALLESNSKVASSDPHYYMVFSTDCSPYQDWQSYLFFYFAKKVNQTGTVTRIASGCKDDDRHVLQKFHDEKIAVMSDSFKIHFAPKCPDSRSKYFNKPYGLRSFMEQVLDYPNNQHDDDIIMIVDPDMMLLRPLTHKFDRYRIQWVLKENTTYDTVEHGRPIAQTYGYGNAWIESLGNNASHVVAEEPGADSLALHLSRPDASKRYPAGPPYLATARDMYQIAIHWTKFVGRVHDIFPKMMSEMFAYSFAAAHLKLPHQLALSFMVSDVDCVDKEGWRFLENVSRDQACVADAIPTDELPYVLHYCQRYALGRWFFNKYKIPKHLLDCDQPLLREPPEDVPVKYNWYMFPNNKDAMVFVKRPFRIVQHGWAMCRIIRAINEVSVDYKTKYCPLGKANLNKTFIFHTPTNFESFLNGNIPDLVQERFRLAS